MDKDHKTYKKKKKFKKKVQKNGWQWLQSADNT